MSCVAIIPARGGSKRLPRKNILEICGQPAIAYPIDCALHCGLFERIIVSTEDNEVATTAKNHGAEVLSRPHHLSTDKATVRQVARHVLSELKVFKRFPETFCIIYPTAVLLEPYHLFESEKLLNDTAIDAVLAVKKLNPHPYKALKIDDGRLEPLFHENFLKKGQELIPYFAPAGAFHWMRSRAFLDAGQSVWQLHRTYYILKSYESVDIDDQEDFEMAKRLLIARKTISNHP
jgi:CMP-N-acetylneuraminic acid synthetase